jgi:hypothetical protein
VANFPQTGLQTQVQWQESQQNFVVTGARFPGVDEGLCTTRAGQADDGSGGIAEVSWGNPCLLSGNTGVLRVQTRNAATVLEAENEREERAAAGGAFFVCASQLTIRQGGQTFTSSDFRLIDIAGDDICRDVPRGGVLNLLLQVRAQSELNFNAPFTIFYNGRTVVDFTAGIPAGTPRLNVSADSLSFPTSTTTALTDNQALVVTEEEPTGARDERGQTGPAQEKSFTITNTGGGTLLGGMTLIASDAGRQSFSTSSDIGINLAAGQSKTVIVRFTPQSSTPVIGSVRITTNGGVKRVLLLGGGQGTATPQATTSVAAIDFGAVVINTAAERSFIVTNTGGGTLTGTVDPQPNSPFSVASGRTLNLAAGQSQIVLIRVTSPNLGTLSDRVTLNTNGGTPAVLLFATIVGQPRLSVDPGKVEFGTVQLPNSATQIFTVTNTGGGTLMGNVNVTNTSTTAPFSLASGGSFVLEANQSQNVTISFSSKATGTFTGAANVTSNGGSTSVSLSATAAQPGPTLSITPTAINFGTLPNNQCTTRTSSFQVSNNGGGTLTGSITTTGGAAGGPSPYSTSPNSFSLTAGQSQTINVVWRPTGTGTDNGTSSISSNGGTGSVSLTGRCTNLITITQ